MGGFGKKRECPMLESMFRPPQRIGVKLPYKGDKWGQGVRERRRRYTRGMLVCRLKMADCSRMDGARVGWKRRNNVGKELLILTC